MEIKRRTKAKPANITFRPPASEKKRLEEYCEATGRTQTDVLREFIRGLEIPEKVA